VHDQRGIHWIVWIVLNDEHTQWLPISASDQMFTRSGGKQLNARREKRFANAPSATPSSDLDHETKETVDGSGVLD